ncbi:MAG TPA: hypothetical protein VJ925_01415, partial [Longimicrobiales bacterium]|nr:hypothetical protein [Longimicrobiales bacterium]
MTVWLGVAAGAVVLTAWYFWRRETYVPCTLDVEPTHEHLHAILDLEGFHPEPGDGVRMENAPQDMSSVAL